MLRNHNNRFYLSETTLKDFGILPVEFLHFPPDNVFTFRLSVKRYYDPHSSMNESWFAKELRADSKQNIVNHVLEEESPHCSKEAIFEVVSNCIDSTDVISDCEKSSNILTDRFNYSGKIELIEEYLKVADCNVDAVKSHCVIDGIVAINHNQHMVVQLRNQFKRQAPHQGQFRSHAARHLEKSKDIYGFKAPHQ